MLDLSRPIDSTGGLALFADHENPDLVYYLPDEIGLAQLGAGEPDLSLQVFYPDDALVGGTAALDKAVGSIFTLGVQCSVRPDRLADARAALAGRLGRTGLQLVAPPWEDGSVDLILLDAKAGETVDTAIRDDRMVRGVVGSRKPSLSGGELNAFFHARLDQRGSALLVAAMEGEAGSLAGVLYDLKFAALRPAVNLVMRANLDSVAESIRAGLGVQVYYVSADVQTAFHKMREKGVIQVDLVSQVADPEAERLVNESVRDFYDVLMRELFKPSVPALDAASLGLGAVSTSIVKLSFSYSKTTRSRVVEVDYRKRSATRRTHNPQRHVRFLAGDAGGAAARTRRVALSRAWREMTVEVAAPEAFPRHPALREIRVVLWRGKDPVLSPAQARDGGLRMPAESVPLREFAFTAQDHQPRQLSWVNMPGEAPFYRWQARLTYAQASDTQSPTALWTAPHVSSSVDLDLFPEILCPVHRAALTLGAGIDGLDSVEAHVTAHDPAGRLAGERRITATPAEPKAGWNLRTSEEERILMQYALTYRFKDGRTLTPATRDAQGEIVVNSPFLKRIKVSPLVVGASPAVLEVTLILTHKDPASGYEARSVARLRPPNFEAPDLEVAVPRLTGLAQWETLVVRADGSVTPLRKGETEGGTLVIRPDGEARRVRVEWLGPAPAALGLRKVTVTLRARKDDGQLAGDPVLFEYRGERVVEEQSAVLPAQGQLQFSVEKRFDDGRKETAPFQPVQGDLVTVP